MGAIADIDHKFLWISVKFPGRAHDSRVFRSSRLYHEFARGQKAGILLADSAYRLERFLLKPILSENRSEAEANFTEALCRGRVVVEHAFGTLKRQFQSLHTELKHNPTRAAKIIVTACCLRNLCILTRERPFSEEESIAPQYPEAGDEEAVETDTVTGSDVRAAIIDRYFRRT
ncbi:hypothetical protein Y032_0004g2001 [Ancylostoma ceylanicum]|uniref:DDE Tnp4 domain-containing protein n=1 Tax=Ancylostoma ceylanicum TaxID=53326 RepID=A0A016VUB5_9BILA|nr:hypothetical protein Y032_0004g2001 [Ancylostoma ceylanicum]